MKREDGKSKSKFPSRRNQPPSERRIFDEKSDRVSLKIRGFEVSERHSLGKIQVAGRNRG